MGKGPSYPSLEHFTEEPFLFFNYTESFYLLRNRIYQTTLNIELKNEEKKKWEKKRYGGYLLGKARKGKESLCAIEREFVPFRSGPN